MTEDDKKAPPPADDAGIQEWIAYALEKSFQADQLNGLNRDQVRALVKGEPMPGATEKPETPTDAPVPARKRASSRTRKAAEVTATPEPEPETSTLDAAQLARVEAVKIARQIIGRESRGFASAAPVDVIPVVDLAEYLLTGAHPLGGFSEAVAERVQGVVSQLEQVPGVAVHDPDDGGPGLTFAGAPTTQEGTA